MFPSHQVIKVITDKSFDGQKIIDHLTFLAPDACLLDKKQTAKYNRFHVRLLVQSSEHLKNVFSQINQIEAVVYIL